MVNENLRDMKETVDCLAKAATAPIETSFCKYDDPEAGETDALTFNNMYWLYQSTMLVKTIAGDREVPCWTVTKLYGSPNGDVVPDEDVVACFRSPTAAAKCFVIEITKGRLDAAVEYQQTKKFAMELGF